MSRRSRHPVRLVAALVLVGAGALSGCGPNQLGAAALVDDARITVSDVQGTLAEVREQRAAQGLPTDLGHDAAQAEVLRRVLALVFEQAARDLGVTVSPGEVAAARAGDDRSMAEVARLAAENNISLGSLDEVFRHAAIEQEIVEALERADRSASQDELAAAYREHLVATAKGMDIRINPRYGTFDAEAGTIVAATADFIKLVES